MANLSQNEALTLAASLVALVISLLAYRRSGPAAELARQQLEELEKEKARRARPTLAYVLSGDKNKSLTVTNSGEVHVQRIEFEVLRPGPVEQSWLDQKCPISLRVGQTVRFPALRTIDGDRECFSAKVTFSDVQGNEFNELVTEYWQ